MTFDYERSAKLLIRKYGSIRGMQINATVVPKLLADFEGMLKKAPKGAKIHEDYRFDDRDGGIRLTGCDGEVTDIELL